MISCFTQIPLIPLSILLLIGIRVIGLMNQINIFSFS
jgi:hypothetical protein